MHQKPRIPPRPKEDGVSCCMMDESWQQKKGINNNDIRKRQ